MKRITFIVLFVATHIFFIFFQINKHNKKIQKTYLKQKYEIEKKELTQQIQELSQQLYQIKKRSSIKQFAEDTLKMGRVNLKQIKKLVVDG